MNAPLKPMPRADVDAMAVEKPKGASPYILAGPIGGVSTACRYNARGWEWFGVTLTGREIPLTREEVDVCSVANVEAFAREVYEEWVRVEFEESDSYDADGWVR